MRTIVAVLVVAAQVSCTPVTDDGGWTGSIEEVDGVTWVRNPAEGLWAGEEGTGFRLELEQVFGVEEEPVDAILEFVTGVAVDGEGNVYVVDRSADRLLAFAPDGRLRWRVGRRGEGPGEMANALGIAWDGERRLYVSNQNGTRIDVWDLDGEYRTSHALVDLDVGQGYVVGLLDPSTLVLRQSTRDVQGTPVVVVTVGGEPRVRGRFVAGSEPELGGDERYRSDVSVQAGHGRIFTGNRVAYRIEELDADAVLRRVITLPQPDLVPAVYEGGTGWHFGEFEAALPLGDDRLLVPRSRIVSFDSIAEFRTLMERARSGDVDFGELFVFDSAFDLLDAEGRYLATWETSGLFDETGSVAAVDGRGNVYTRLDDPFPQVRRYRVVIDPPP